MTGDGQFYFSLGRELYNLNYKSFDDASIFSYTKNNTVLQEGFIRRGGIKSVEQMTRILNDENIETYYDNLVKNNMLMSLHDKGFNVVKDMKDFNKMTTSQLYSFFEYQLDNVFLNRGAGVKIEDLEIDDQFLQDCHDGIEKGLSYHETAPLLNYHTMGIHKSNVQIFAGYSGTGKTSFAVGVYIMPILDQGEKMVIIANEMNIKAWKHIVLSTILSQKLKYYQLTRKKQKSGNFSEEQWKLLKEAQKYFNEHYKGQLKFAKIYDYSVEDVKRICRKMAKQGCDYVLYDTFKAENSASDKMTGELIEASKQLLQVAEKEDIGIIITMQLALHTEGTRYLTAQTLSGAKGVKEVVSELVLMRSLWEDEFKSEKFDVKPYRFKRDSVSGKSTNIKEEIELNPDKKYRIMFLDKTRNDEGEICLIFQFDGAWNKWTEIGYCSPKHQRL